MARSRGLSNSSPNLQRCVVDGERHIFGEIDQRETVKAIIAIAIILPVSVAAVGLTGWARVPGWVYGALVVGDVFLVWIVFAKLRIQSRFIVTPDCIRYEQRVRWSDGTAGFEYALNQCDYLASYHEGDDDLLFLGGQSDQIVWTINREQIGLSTESWQEVIWLLSYHCSTAKQRADEVHWPMGRLGLKTMKNWIRRDLWETFGNLSN